MTDEKEFYMQRAITLAEKGKGRVNPNPLVGAVVVKDGKIIGEGYHEYYGGLHAERNALKNCKESSEGATLYVTLEPCCHYGKTPPCTEAILEHRIRKVVVGMTDPNPLMAGKSIGAFEIKRRGSRSWGSGKRMHGTDTYFSEIYNNKNSLYINEICNDDGRKDCNCKRKIQMDYR